MPDIKPVRIDPELYEIISRIADTESRSITKQVNYMLQKQLQATESK